MSSSLDLDRRRGRGVVGEHGETRQSRIVSTAMRWITVGHIQRIGQPLGERRFVDQDLGAAIGEDIGDLRLLLARAEQHRHQPLMRGGKQQQRKFDAIAEQDRDAIAALQAELAKARRDPRGLLHGLPPAQPDIACDQRFAVGIAGAGVRDHRPQARRPIAEGRHHPIAEARLEPHRRDLRLRPVHRDALGLLLLSPSAHGHARCRLALIG